MPAPTYDYFGSNPVTIIFSSPTSLDGTTYGPSPIGVITPGVVAFTPAPGGGMLDFHTRPLLIQNIMAKIGLTVDVSMMFDTTEVVVGKIDATNKSIAETFVLPVNAKLKLVSSGAGEVFVTAQEYAPGTTI